MNKTIRVTAKFFGILSGLYLLGWAGIGIKTILMDAMTPRLLEFMALFTAAVLMFCIFWFFVLLYTKLWECDEG